VYKNGEPIAALTVFDEKGNFLGYTLAGAEDEGVSEIVYAFLPEY
jgi:hypothetical protein